MSDFATLQNLTERALPVVYKGRAKTIPPKGQLTETRDFVQFAKAKYGNFVQELTEQTTVSYVEPQPDNDMYIANMTGNPDAPMSFVVATRKNKKTGLHEDVIEENENRAAQVIEESLGMRHVNYEGQLAAHDGVVLAASIGTNTVTRLGKTIRILPLQRVKVPRELGYELLKRDAQRPRHQRGKLIRARAPQAFEPKMAWTLEQKHAWLQLVDHEFRNNPALLGPTEAEIRAENPDEEVANALVAEANHKAFARCFQRMMPNNEVPLPTERDFEIYTKEQKALKKHLSAKVTG